jgi:hypothetical protein
MKREVGSESLTSQAHSLWLKLARPALRLAPP